jgi:hypothetical protein
MPHHFIPPVRSSDLIIKRTLLVRIKRTGGVIIPARLLQAAGGETGAAPVVAKLPVIRIKADRALKIGQGFFQATQLQQGEAPRATPPLEVPLKRCLMRESRIMRGGVRKKGDWREMRHVESVLLCLAQL